MEFDFAALAAADRYKLMVSTIVPRPIAWVVTRSAAGVVNAAPYSFFNGVSADPPLVSVSIEARPLELYYGLDLSAMLGDAETSEVAFNKVSSPSTIYRRFMAITQDGAGADAVYLGRFHPRMSITNAEEQSWTDGNEIQYGVTGTAYVDPILGFSTRLFFGGPGWANMLEAAGFEKAEA